MSTLWVVARKELRDHLRDRRSLSSALIIPLVGPLMFAALFTQLARWERSDGPLRVPVAGAQHAPNLVAFLERQGAQITPAPPDYQARVRDGELEVAVAIPDDYAAAFSGGRPAPVELYSDSSNNKARRTVRRVQRLLTAYSAQLGALRLVARGLSPTLASPLELQEVDVATPERSAAQVLGMVPLFLLMAVFIGGMHLAADSLAGERERGSLEPLLLNPVPRSAVVLGKWVAVLAVTWGALLATLAGFSLALARVPLQDLGIKARLGLPEVGQLLLVLLPLSLFTAAVQMLLSLFARTYKEAQTYLSLLSLVPTLPAALLSLSPLKPALWMMALPSLAQTMLMNDVLRGEPLRPGWWLLASVLTAGCAGACLAGAMHLLGKEAIVFGRSGGG